MLRPSSLLYRMQKYVLNLFKKLESSWFSRKTLRYHFGHVCRHFVS